MFQVLQVIQALLEPLALLVQVDLLDMAVPLGLVELLVTVVHRDPLEEEVRQGILDLRAEWVCTVK